MDTFSALADPTRRTIIELLSVKGQLPASSIYKHFNASSPAISQHLKVLRDAELVTVEQKAQQRLYQINAEKIMELEDWIKTLSVSWNKKLDALEKVLEKQNKLKMKGGGK